MPLINTSCFFHRVDSGVGGGEGAINASFAFSFRLLRNNFFFCRFIRHLFWIRLTNKMPNLHLFTSTGSVLSRGRRNFDVHADFAEATCDRVARDEWFSRELRVAASPIRRSPGPLVFPLSLELGGIWGLSHCSIKGERKSGQTGRCGEEDAAADGGDGGGADDGEGHQGGVAMGGASQAHPGRARLQGGMAPQVRSKL